MSLIRVTGEHFPGREHWAAIRFVEAAPHESTVVDLTPRQFNPNAHWPWVGTLPDWYDACVDWLNDSLIIETYVDPQDHPTWDDAYSRDDHVPGPVWLPWAGST